jgi:hypothetical protein
MIATGPDLKKAMWLAVELETIAKQYYLSLAIGGPNILPDAEIEHVRDRTREGKVQSLRAAPEGQEGDDLRTSRQCRPGGSPPGSGEGRRAARTRRPGCRVAAFRS